MKKGFLHYKRYRTTLQGGFMNSKIKIKSQIKGLKKNLMNNLKCLSISLVALLSLAGCSTVTRDIAQENDTKKIQVNEHVASSFQSKRLQKNNEY